MRPVFTTAPSPTPHKAIPYVHPIRTVARWLCTNWLKAKTSCRLCRLGVSKAASQMKARTHQSRNEVYRIPWASPDVRFATGQISRWPCRSESIWRLRRLETVSGRFLRAWTACFASLRSVIPRVSVSRLNRGLETDLERDKTTRTSRHRKIQSGGVRPSAQRLRRSPPAELRRMVSLCRTIDIAGYGYPRRLPDRQRIEQPKEPGVKQF